MPKSLSVGLLVLIYLRFVRSMTNRGMTYAFVRFSVIDIKVILLNSFSSGNGPNSTMSPNSTILFALCH